MKFDGSFVAVILALIGSAFCLPVPYPGDNIQIGVNGNGNQVVGKVSGGNVIIHQIGKRSPDNIQIGITGNGNQAVGAVYGGGSVLMSQGGTSNLKVTGGAFGGSFPFPADNIKLGIQGDSNQVVGIVGRGKRQINGNENQVIGSISGQGNTAIGKFKQQVNKNNGHVMNFEDTVIHGGFNVGRAKRSPGDTISIGINGNGNQAVGKITGGGSVFLSQGGSANVDQLIANAFSGAFSSSGTGQVVMESGSGAGSGSGQATQSGGSSQVVMQSEGAASTGSAQTGMKVTSTGQVATQA